AIEIIEFAPPMAGVARCGATFAPGTKRMRWGIGPHNMRAMWKIRVEAGSIEWHRVGWAGGQAGVDPHVRIRVPDELICLINRLKPAHTVVHFVVVPPGSLPHALPVEL
ncbi:MAG: hypothetical protein AAFY46_17205, partial [Planctomycetota bacterium]